MSIRSKVVHSKKSQRNDEINGLPLEHQETMNKISKRPIYIPSLQVVRSSVSSRITQVVEFFLAGEHRFAHVDEIVDGIQIDNRAEKESVYSTIDPYSDGAAKRDRSKPLLFRRVSPGYYEFLGFDGDPLDLTEKLTFRSELIREAHRVFLGEMRRRGQEAEIKSKSTAERIKIFQGNLEKAPRILEIASEILSVRADLEIDVADLRI